MTVGSSDAYLSHCRTNENICQHGESGKAIGNRAQLYRFKCTLARICLQTEGKQGGGERKATVDKEKCGRTPSFTSRIHMKV